MNESYTTQMKNVFYSGRRHVMGIILFLLAGSIIPVIASSGSEEVTQGVTQQQQKFQISGTVHDGSGEALVGASVKEKGTANGTVTNLDGQFNLSVNVGATLEVTYLGYITQDVKVTWGTTQYTINLKEDTHSLEEVVVMGYGVQKKKLVTGATVQVSADNIQKMGKTNALGAMQGQTPGAVIIQQSGMPGQSYKITIRGLGTNGTPDPLYVIDGIAPGDINNLNPADIESIDVLKDAASAAIYGSRAANGVVLVTTKQGKSGKMQLSYDGYYGIQNFAKKPPLLNAKQYMTIVNEQRFNDGSPLYDFSQLIPTQYPLIENGSWNGTNWLDEMENKDAPIQNHAFNLAGGSDVSKFIMGFSYSDQEGIFGKPVQLESKRYTARINSDHVLLKGKNFDVIRIGENLLYGYNQSTGIGIGDMYWNDVHNALVANPLLPAYNSTGGYYIQADKNADNWALDGSAVNPIADMVYRRGNNISKGHTLVANVYAEIQPIKNLKYRAVYGYNMSAGSYRSYTPAVVLSTTTGSSDRTNQSAWSGYNWSFNNTLSYVFNINNDHNFDVLAGYEMTKSGYGDNISATGGNSLFPGQFDYAWLDNSNIVEKGITAIGGYPWGEGALQSFIGRINYNYQEKYMLSLIMREDGSSNFAKGHRWGNFPSISAGWVLTNESFMQSFNNWMDFFKLRASWGQNGNQNILNFQYLATIGIANKNAYYFGNDKTTIYKGGYPDILPNPDVTWETSEQTDIGFDARFLKSRLGVNFDWYLKKTKDWLLVAPILDSYGTNPPAINGGDVQNKGIEAVLSWNDNISRDFTYGVSFNFTHQKNEVTKIINSEGIIHGKTDVLSQGTKEMYRLQVGYPMGYFYGYKTAGVFQNAEQVANTAVKLPGAQAGDLIYVDTDGNGVIDDNDKCMIGNPNPDYTLGFSLNVGYKGFDLGVSAMGMFGQQIAKSYRSFVDLPLQNYTEEIFGRWHGEGTSNRLPRLTSGSNPNWQNISDIYIEDGDYLKIQNITLGYDFKKLCPKLPFGQARVYVAVQNLYTFTKYSGMDPEIGYGADQSWVSGIDVGFYPSPRTYMVGVNLKF